jgi:hypothetical protein
LAGFSILLKDVAVFGCSWPFKRLFIPCDNRPLSIDNPYSLGINWSSIASTSWLAAFNFIKFFRADSPLGLEGLDFIGLTVFDGIDCWSAIRFFNPKPSLPLILEGLADFL